MPKPWKDPEIQNKIRQWVEKNPSRWYTAKYEDIRVETGVSVSSLYRYFPLIVAKAADILPSEVSANERKKWGLARGDANSLTRRSLKSNAFTMKDTRVWIFLL